MHRVGSGGPTVLCHSCWNRLLLSTGHILGSKTAHPRPGSGAVLWSVGSRVAVLPTSAGPGLATWHWGTLGLAQGNLASTSSLHLAGHVRGEGSLWEQQSCTCGTGSGALAGREQATACADDAEVALGPCLGHLRPRVPFPGPLVQLLAAFRLNGQVPLPGSLSGTWARDSCAPRAQRS